VKLIGQAIKNGAKSEAFFLAPFFLLAFLSVFSLSGTLLPFLELTASWQSVLEYAARSKLQFGRDIVFTYGPLGYLGTIYSQGHLVVQRIVFALAWAALTAWSATTIVQKLSGLPKGVFIVWVLFLFSRGGMDVQAYLVLACGYSILAEDVQQRKGLSSIFIISFAVLSLIKFTFFMTAVASVALASLAHVGRKQVTSSLVIPLSFGTAIMISWMATGQHPANFWPWIKGSLEITGGYSEAMTVVPITWVFRLCFLSLSLFIAAVALRITSTRLNMSSAGSLLLITFCTFLSWKHGFVRADDHVLYFIYFLPVSFGVVLAGPVRKPASSMGRLSLTLLYCAATVLCLFAMNIQKKGEVQVSFAEWPGRLLYNTDHVVKSLTGNGAACFAALRNPQKRGPELPIARSLIGGSTVDVINCLQWAALANSLNYHPRPVFQGYSAYTPYLQDLNLAFFQSSDRPSYLLFNMETIDSRYVTMDDAAILPYVFKNYDLVGQEGKFLLLRAKKESPIDVPMKLIHEQTTSFNTKIDLSDWHNVPLLMQVDVKPTFVGRLTTFVYQSPVLSLNIHADDGVLSTRFIPGMAKRGFLINPLIFGNKDVANLYQGTGTRVAGISFSRSDFPLEQLSDEIAIKLYRLE